MLSTIHFNPFISQSAEAPSKKQKVVKCIFETNPPHTLTEISEHAWKYHYNDLEEIKDVADYLKNNTDILLNFRKCSKDGEIDKILLRYKFLECVKQYGKEDSIKWILTGECIMAIIMIIHEEFPEVNITNDCGFIFNKDAHGLQLSDIDPDNRTVGGIILEENLEWWPSLIIALEQFAYSNYEIVGQKSLEGDSKDYY